MTAVSTSCPRCRTPLELPGGGSYDCTRCKVRFLYRSVAPAPTPLPASRIDPQSGARCATHAGRPALCLCERCGDCACELCITRVEGRWYCPRCFDLLWDRGAFGFCKQGFYLPQLGGMLAWTSWLAWMVPGLNVAVAGMAIATAIQALNQIRDKPELPGRRQAIQALVIAGLNLALVPLFVLLMVGMYR
jgi:hypothetical protein